MCKEYETVNQLCLSIQWQHHYENFAYFVTIQLVYLLISACIVSQLNKKIHSQLVKKSPAFYGNRRFITAFRDARHLSLF
jgi:hypothetical protein